MKNTTHFCPLCNGAYLQTEAEISLRTEAGISPSSRAVLECPNCGHRAQIALFALEPNLPVRKAWMAAKGYTPTPEPKAAQ